MLIIFSKLLIFMKYLIIKKFLSCRFSLPGSGFGSASAWIRMTHYNICGSTSRVLRKAQSAHTMTVSKQTKSFGVSFLLQSIRQRSGVGIFFKSGPDGWQAHPLHKKVYTVVCTLKKNLLRRPVSTYLHG